MSGLRPSSAVRPSELKLDRVLACGLAAVTTLVPQLNAADPASIWALIASPSAPEIPTTGTVIAGEPATDGLSASGRLL